MFHVRRARSFREILRTFAFPDDDIGIIVHSPFVDSVLLNLPSGLPFLTAQSFAQHILDLGLFPCSRQSFSCTEDVIHCAV